MKIPLIDREHLTDVDDASLREASLSSFEEHIPRGPRPRQVRRDDANYHGINPAPVEDIVLHDDVGMAKPWGRARGCSEVNPEDVALRDYHSPDTLRRCRRRHACCTRFSTVEGGSA